MKGGHTAAVERAFRIEVLGPLARLYIAPKFPLPYRTRKLSLLEPMILHGFPCGKVGSRRIYFTKARSLDGRAFCDLTRLAFTTLL